MIYDCFSFFNELDIIEIRFKELYDHVHRFVLCESTLTHAGTPKPLYFQENKDRYAPFQDKIINVVCDNPSTPEPNYDMNWTRERNQRNFIYNTLNQLCKNDDIIITSDADEIFRSENINKLQAIDSNLYSIEMRPSWYYLNCVSEPRWTLGKAAKFSTVKNGFKGNLSDIRGAGTSRCLVDSGWHFSYMGGQHKVKQKLESFAHQEFNNPQNINDYHINLIMRFGSAVWDEFNDINPRGNIPYWNYESLSSCNLPACVKKGDYNHLISEVGFSKLDYDCGNLYHLFNLAKKMTGNGLVIDVGCYEGRTSVYLVNALPDQVYCVDINIPDQFYKNMNSLSDGNFSPVQTDALSFIQKITEPIKFLHIDVDDFDLTNKIIEAATPKLARNYVICGYSRTRNYPNNLRAKTSKNFWFSF